MHRAIEGKQTAMTKPAHSGIASKQQTLENTEATMITGFC